MKYRTCGNCIFFQGGRCYPDLPIWVLRSMDNIVGRSSCSSDDTQAQDCDQFIPRCTETDDDDNLLPGLHSVE